MRPVKIEGFGVIGSTLARALDAAGIPFVWTDNYHEFPAWKASTGCVAADSYEDVEPFAEWERFEHLVKPFTERAPRFTRAGLGRPWAQASDSLHVNVAEMVLFAWRRYASAYAPTAQADLMIRTAGAVTAKTFWWGWSGKIAIPVPRACWYLRQMSLIRYLYPMPGHANVFYAGSSIVQQRAPRVISAEKSVALWTAHMAEAFPEFADRLSIVDVTQGWRPRGDDGDLGVVDFAEGVWTVRPQSASGVKYAPLIARKIVEKLKESGY